MKAPRERRSRVVVTGPATGGHLAWWAIRRALRHVGASARRKTPAAPGAEVGSAVVLAGGSHVHPSAYDAAPIHDPSAYDPTRDAMETDVLFAARRRGARVLAICRGMQLAAVAAGGRLDQDVWASVGQLAPRRTSRPRRAIRLAPDSRLAGIVGRDVLRVNCLHSQAIAHVPAPYEVVAWDEYGVPYAIEAPGVIGVQWHPEYLPRRSASRALFGWVAGGVLSDHRRVAHLPPVSPTASP